MNTHTHAVMTEDGWMEAHCSRWRLIRCESDADIIVANTPRTTAIRVTFDDVVNLALDECIAILGRGWLEADQAMNQYDYASSTSQWKASRLIVAQNEVALHWLQESLDIIRRVKG